MDKLIVTLMCLKQHNKKWGKYISAKILRLTKDLNCIKTALKIRQYLQQLGFDINMLVSDMTRTSSIISGFILCKFYMDLTTDDNDIDFFSPINRSVSLGGIIKDNLYVGEYEHSNKMNYIKYVAGLNTHSIKNIKINIIKLLCDRPKDCIKKCFDMDCCKIIYDGYNVYIDDDVHYDINNMVTIAKLNKVHDLNSAYRNDTRVGNLRDNSYSSYNDAIFKSFRDIFNGVYNTAHTYNHINGYASWGCCDGVVIKTINTQDHVDKFKKYINIIGEKINLNEILISDNYSNDSIEVINHIQYLDRIERYTNKGFFVIHN